MLLAIYDVTGIQDYIFSSNKLKDNIGASIIVQKSLESFLLEAIEKVGKEQKEQIWVDWEKDEYEFKMLPDPEIKIEVIYIGGGNALVAFNESDPNLCKQVTKEFSIKLLKETAGMLQFATACVETNNNFKNDLKKLLLKLQKHKYKKTSSFPLQGISITRRGLTDGLPAQVKQNEEYLSLSTFKKRETEKNESEYFDKKYLIKPELKDKYYFTDLLDDLVKKDHEPYIAVVHIDGNSMGEKINNLLEDSENYKFAVPKIREFSDKINQKYKQAMINMIEGAVKGINKLSNEKKDRLPHNRKDDKDMILIRPIVQNGDDVTFVCSAPIAISCVEKFLKFINDAPIEISGNKIALSACVGIAFVKSHFPFYRAYELSKSLCQSAKAKGRVIKKKLGIDEMACWFDFHTVLSGVTSNLNEIREFQYCVPGMNRPAPLKVDDFGKEMVSHIYNLLWRPWYVAGNINQEYLKYSWENGKKIFNEFTEARGEEWPLSRLHSLRREFCKSREDVETYIYELKSRGLALPAVDGIKEVFSNDYQTAYVDILELLDLYIEI